VGAQLARARRRRPAGPELAGPAEVDAVADPRAQARLARRQAQVAEQRARNASRFSCTRSATGATDGSAGVDGFHRFDVIRQLLDNAQRATGGRVERPTRMALWMRAMNAVEARLSAPARSPL